MRLGAWARAALGGASPAAWPFMRRLPGTAASSSESSSSSSSSSCSFFSSSDSGSCVSGSSRSSCSPPDSPLSSIAAAPSFAALLMKFLGGACGAAFVAGFSAAFLGAGA